MIELVDARRTGTNFRWQLLATASALALIGAIYGAKAADDDSSPSSVWIELGGQLGRLDEGQETFAPPLIADRPSMFASSQKFERLPLYSIDETGKLSFHPHSSDWVVSVAVRYGRSTSNKHVRQQTNPKSFFLYGSYHGRQYKITGHPTAGRFADTTVQTGEQHLVLDFQVGKDVGLGMFGDKDATSVLGLGIRFAQFTSKSNIALKSNPDWHWLYRYDPGLLNYGFPSTKIPRGGVYHSNSANLRAERSFHGVGPSLSWNASVPLVSNSQGGNLAFDGGLNAAVLFGRQRAKVHQQLTGLYHDAYQSPGTHVTIYHPPQVNAARTRIVAVPNVGGFAGASWRIENFKASLGYRADFFFGAMDGGIDTAKKENIGFYGPFASVSIGL